MSRSTTAARLSAVQSEDGHAGSESGWKLAAPRGSWLWIAGIVLAFALVLDGVHTQAGFLAEGNPQSWVQTLRETAIFWLVYAAFIPLVLFIANRFPLDPRRPRNILIHLQPALSFTYLHVVVVAFSVLPWRTGVNGVGAAASAAGCASTSPSTF